MTGRYSRRIRVIRNDLGQELAEYALLVATVALMVIFGLQLLGAALTSKYLDAGTSLSGSGTASSGGTPDGGTGSPGGGNQSGGGPGGPGGPGGNSGTGGGNSGNGGSGDGGGDDDGSFTQPTPP